MHILLTAFFACLFGFSHNSAAFASRSAEGQRAAAAAEHMPTRTELEHAAARNGYAEAACVSCRRTDISWRTR